MNALPDDFVLHNLPLIVLSGLGNNQDDTSAGSHARTLLSEGGFRIRTDLAPVTGETAEQLLQSFISHDATNEPWHERGSEQGKQRFKILTAGRVYTLPPRKAPPPAHSPLLRPANDAGSPPPQLILHSPISPLTPSSPLYPDGVVTPLWIAKHQFRLPSIFMSFFTLTSDGNTSTLQDNKLKSEIYNIRSVLTSTNYKTKLVVILIGDGRIATTDAEERVKNIRKATTLDTKSLCYLAAGLPEDEVAAFTGEILSSLYAESLEYYRDLSKHARRKRNRNVIPQPTIQPTSGTSRTLPLAGWNARYEFKLGVFAEFRQEMEAALRSYETAYEGLFGPEVFETIPSWSPRFNETRMLSDVIAIRIIRCLLWLGQTTNSVKWWTSHRGRIQALLDRKSTGTNTYGWEAWQAIWSRVMADLINRSQVLISSEQSRGEPSLPQLFVSSEKTLPAGQRYAPWESLHHEGYWLNLAQRYIHKRRDRALDMPEEDRTSPGQSPASTIASKAHLYDRYLVPEPYREFPLDDKPGYHYSEDIISALNDAVKHFSERNQVRMVDTLSLKKAAEMIRAEDWEAAYTVIVAVWNRQTWRQAGWWDLLEHLGKGLLTCAINVDRADTITQLKWQLEHPVTRPKNRRGEKDEIHTNETTKMQTALDTNQCLTRCVPAFAFATVEGHVGEPLDAQLVLQNIGSFDDDVFQLLQVKIVFEGGLKPVYLIHNDREVSDDDSNKAKLLEIQLEDEQSRQSGSRRTSLGVAAAMTAEVSLSLLPRHTKIFQMQVTPREAGDASVASVTMTFKHEQKEISVTSPTQHDMFGQWWEMRRGKPVARPCGRLEETNSATILPKPPKLDIRFSETRRVFYTNESIELNIECENLEDGAIAGSIDARLISPGKNSTRLMWDNGTTSLAEEESDVTHVQRLQAKTFGEVKVKDRTVHSVFIEDTDEAIDHELEIVVNYALVSSPENKLTKLITLDVPIIRPFEANFSFHSRLHNEIWPAFFSSDTISHDAERAVGIKQQYLITAVVASFAQEEIVIELTRLKTEKIVGGATCTITEGSLRQKTDNTDSDNNSQILMRPEGNKRFGFDMTIQKLVLGDRQPVAVDVSLEIKWRRQDHDKVNTSILQVPRFLAPSAEPRVLLETVTDPTIPSLHRLSYTIENPSLHFLTFNLTMDSSEDFAFSGIKSQSLNLVPISRHSVNYRILANKNKAWIKVHLEVVDAYFGQTLKVQPASDGIRVDKQGNVLVWVD